MSDLRRVTFLAVVFAVLLRMAIGWQFFYEGLWKYDTLDTAKPWTSAGYLSNARGPLRDHFRGMVDDPDGLGWLDYKTVNERWTEWQQRFEKHYGLTDEQKQDLNLLLDGPDEIVGRGRFREFAKGISIGGSLKRDKIITARKDSKNRYYLVVNGDMHLTPRERDNLLRMAKKVEDRERKKAAAASDPAEKMAATRQADLAKAFYDAVKDVYTRNARLGFREKLAGMLKGDPKRVAVIREQYAPGTIDHQRPGKTGEYKDRLQRYEKALAEAELSFQQDHLNSEYRRILELKAELVGPVKKLEADLKAKAKELLTAEQRAKGPLPQPNPFESFDPAHVTVEQADVITMWALMIFGGLLFVGLFSRVTAFLGALLVLQFYLVMPPFPGVPPAPGPEHSLIVNKNLIEILALFTLAFMPTGKWFGIDSFFVWLFPGRYAKSTSRRRRKSKSSRKPEPALKPTERSLNSGGSTAQNDKQESKEPVKAGAAGKETYPIKPDKKSS